MDKFTIKRTSKTMQGVFGTLLDKYGGVVGTTAERPDLGNKQDVSCIPEGIYLCSKHNSPSKGLCIKILDVKGRTNVLMHVGNKPLVDSEGCILVGSGYGFYDDQPVVTDSKKAMAKFMSLADNDFYLSIQDVSDQTQTRQYVGGKK